MDKQIFPQEERKGSENIASILERINTRKTPISSNAESPFRSSLSVHLPACNICNDLGFVRKDVPIEHPDFGKVDFSECRKEEAQKAELQKMYFLCGLSAFSDLTFERFDVTAKGAGDLIEVELKRALVVCKHYANNPFNHWLL